jgi:hypothetical protein
LERIEKFYKEEVSRIYAIVTPSPYAYVYSTVHVDKSTNTSFRDTWQHRLIVNIWWGNELVHISHIPKFFQGLTGFRETSKRKLNRVSFLFYVKKRYQDKGGRWSLCLIIVIRLLQMVIYGRINPMVSRKLIEEG